MTGFVQGANLRRELRLGNVERRLGRGREAAGRTLRDSDGLAIAVFAGVVDHYSI